LAVLALWGGLFSPSGETDGEKSSLSVPPVAFGESTFVWNMSAPFETRHARFAQGIWKEKIT